MIPIVNDTLGTVTKRTGIGTEGLGKKRTSGDHTKNNIIVIGQNTKKSRGYKRRLAGT